MVKLHHHPLAQTHHAFQTCARLIGGCTDLMGSEGKGGMGSLLPKIQGQGFGLIQKEAPFAITVGEVLDLTAGALWIRLLPAD